MEVTHNLQAEGGGYLESDVDPQLLWCIQFDKALKLHSLQIHAPEGKYTQFMRARHSSPLFRPSTQDDQTVRLAREHGLQRH
jgi:hypothetical protein